MLKRYFKLYAVLLLLLVAMPSVSRAQFGGSSIVFDPQMFARQLLQLQQETAAVTNLAQQLQYMVKNTTGGGAGIGSPTRTCSAILADSSQNSRGFPIPSRASPSNSSSSIRVTTCSTRPVRKVRRRASIPR
jgi:hypothetical protein